MADPHLFGTDLFGDPAEPDVKHAGPLAARFLLPPFTILNAREGAWQERKRAWIRLGIRSELGRWANTLGRQAECEEYRNGGGDYTKSARTFGSGGPGTLDEQRKAWRAASTFGTGGVGNGGLCERNAPRTNRLAPGGTGANTAPSGVGGAPGNESESGTSIFDPVLCELSYRWFCPPGGQVVDPFAGGSVRGIVAAQLGRRYWGCDLRPEQCAANRVQGDLICYPGGGMDAPAVSVKVSAANARLPFHGCTPEYIRDVCHGACCRSSTHPDGILVTVHPSEELRLIDRGAVVERGFLRPVQNRCPFQGPEHLCGLHGTADKPFGCIASPFTLNDNGTLIVRNRYKLLRCYDDGPRLPAYVAFRASLDLLFGTDEAARIAAHLDAGGGDLYASMPAANYQMLRDNDAAKKGVGSRPLEWACGDAADLLPGAPQADFLFTCPPYGDLERYSDDPRDLSTMEYHTFIPAYKRILLRAAARLKPDRFACVVVGNFRDGKGMLRDFCGDTVRAFEECGLRYYNDAVLVTQVGSLPIRVGKQFVVSRKLGRTHQSVLVFVKGCPRKAAALCEQE